MARKNMERYDDLYPEYSTEEYLQEEYLQEEESYQAPRSSLSSRDRFMLLGLVPLCFICCVAIIYCHTQIINIGQQINFAQQDLGLLRVESNDLYAQVNRLTSLENIEKIAINRIGMVKLPVEQVLFVEESTSRGVAGTTEQTEEVSPAVTGELPTTDNWLTKTLTDLSSAWKDSIQMP